MDRTFLFLLIFFGISCTAQSSVKFNLDFEEYNTKAALAEGWFKWGNYELGTDTISHTAKYSGKIKSDQNGSSFGSIAYSIPANYNGSTIELTGFMKIKDVEGGFAGILLRVDGNGTTLAFDNMQNQNITGTRDWAQYKIELPYPEGAENIYIAGILVGKGEAWFDDFEMSIDGIELHELKEMERSGYKANLDKEFDSGSNIAFPALSDTLIGNLELLGRVWGLLKYHHPEVAKGNYNWDYELFRMLPDYLKAQNPIDRDRKLIGWIDKYGELSDCDTCKPTSLEAVVKPDLDWIHHGSMSPGLKSKLERVYQTRNQGKNYYIGLVSNIGNPEFRNENPYPNKEYPDKGFRLLALYKYWNMINYFYPNKHLMDKNWNQTLKEYIPKFINAQDELEYEMAALLIIGDIQDTHANLWGGNNALEAWKGKYYPPIHVRFIENRLVVTDYYNPELKDVVGLEVGDFITNINGKPIEDIIVKIGKYYPASNEPTRLRDISADMLRSNDKEIAIDYVHDEKKETKNLVLYPRDSLDIYQWYRRDDESSYKLLENNIGYVTLKSIKEADISNIREIFKNTKGIIIDIRNYPSTFVPFSLGSYFVSTPTPFVKFSNGNVDNPGEFTFTDNIEIPSSSETYHGKLVVLVNELSQSQAEYTAMAFRAGDRTTIIGSTTAGADGNVSTIFLPGGLRTMISGIGVYYPDGTETQRIGIVPDIVVRPTINGVKHGRDELMEKAIEIIND